eukprot:gnl/Spiro4/25572_TR12736_c0_g1_i1.p1 gnl/Spiro4/25572_TR12736_c0_g1~~gnl/Spiro4/25572_TR12736_c0_g1_i1.p1  ORF type:complete len:645 (+),score=101.64 gnl/Spiro4/25572_TR12736_c0_g1_i1:114-2048(+)
MHDPHDFQRVPLIDTRRELSSSSSSSASSAASSLSVPHPLEARGKDPPVLSFRREQSKQQQYNPPRHTSGHELGVARPVPALVPARPRESYQTFVCAEENSELVRQQQLWDTRPNRPHPWKTCIRLSVVFFVLLSLVGLFVGVLAMMNKLDASTVNPELQRIMKYIMSSSVDNSTLWADVRELVNTIGARPTSTSQCASSLRWAAERFNAANVSVSNESFVLPLWVEDEVSLTFSVDGLPPFAFTAPASCKTYSASTNNRPFTGPVVDVGFPTTSHLDELGSRGSLRGAWMLVPAPQVHSLPDLEAWSANSTVTEEAALKYGALGVLYQSVYLPNVLSRSLPAALYDNIQVLIVVDRAASDRVRDLLARGSVVTASILVRTTRSNSTSANLIAEIPGSSPTAPTVLVGTHIDTTEFGSGTYGSGCNVANLIDIARTFKALGLQPHYNIRFVLFTGMEQFMLGSWRYTQQHKSELERFRLALFLSPGCSFIDGFDTGGRQDYIFQLTDATRQIATMAYSIDIPRMSNFSHTTEPNLVTTTDNLDFILQGVPTVFAMHAVENYVSIARTSSDVWNSDVSFHALIHNSAVLSSIVWLFSSDQYSDSWPRRSSSDVSALLESTGLQRQMKSLTPPLWTGWVDGSRGYL